MAKAWTSLLKMRATVRVREEGAVRSRGLQQAPTPFSVWRRSHEATLQLQLFWRLVAQAHEGQQGQGVVGSAAQHGLTLTPLEGGNGRA